MIELITISKTKKNIKNSLKSIESEFDEKHDLTISPTNRSKKQSSVITLNSSSPLKKKTIHESNPLSKLMEVYIFL